MKQTTHHADWPKEDPLWKAMGQMPEAELPPGFARLVMARATRTQGLAAAVADIRGWASILARIFSAPRALALTAAAVAAAAALFLTLPDRTNLRQQPIAELPEEIDFELVKNLDLFIAKEESEQWLYVSAN